MLDHSRHLRVHRVPDDWGLPLRFQLPLPLSGTTRIRNELLVHSDWEGSEHSDRQLHHQQGQNQESVFQVPADSLALGPQRSNG